MLINLATQIVNLGGTPIPEADGKPMTLKSIFCNALIGQRQGEAITGIEKVRRYNLAMSIYNSTEACLGMDDTKLLRDLVADGYTPLVVGQVWNILDPSPSAEETPETPPPDGIETKPGTM